MEEDRLYIGPTPGYVLNRIRSQTWTWPQCLGAFIDHALQTEALHISFVFGKDEVTEEDVVTITDDGWGIAAPQDLLIVSFTKRDLASAIIALGDHVEIVSRHEYMERAVTCDWAALAKSRTWDIEIDEARNEVDLSGTTIRITHLVKRLPQVSRLMRTLQTTYATAIKDGKSIELSDTRSRPKQEYITPQGRSVWL